MGVVSEIEVLVRFMMEKGVGEVRSQLWHTDDNRLNGGDDDGGGVEIVREERGC